MSNTGYKAVDYHLRWCRQRPLFFQIRLRITTSFSPTAIANLNKPPIFLALTVYIMSELRCTHIVCFRFLQRLIAGWCRPWINMAAQWRPQKRAHTLSGKKHKSEGSEWTEAFVMRNLATLSEITCSLKWYKRSEEQEKSDGHKLQEYVCESGAQWSLYK
jgi:hypothetical protein